MRRLRGFVIRLIGLARRARRDKEFAAEIASHVQLHIDENIRAGLSPEQARRAALLKFGGVESVRDAYRDRATVPALSDLVRDFRYGVRALVATPWYSLTAIGVIALSMTLAVTVFAVVDGVLFRPLPIPDPDRVFVVSAPYGYGASMREVREWAAAVPEVQLAVFRGTRSMGAVGRMRPRDVEAAGIGPTFLATLGTMPLVGGFTRDHFQPAAGPVPALISYELARQEFGGAATAVGRWLEIAGAVDHVGRPVARVEVVGVLPEDFAFPDGQGAPELLVPMTATAEQDGERNWGQARALARLPQFMSSVEVQARLTAVAQQQRFPTPDSARSPLRVGVDPVQRELGYAFGKEFRTVAAAAAVVLLLGCVNVSGLALGRRRQRSREMAMRRALGASDWQLARVALSEALPLGLAGTVAGIALASAVVRVIVSVMPAYIVLVKTPAIDWRVLGFAAIALTLTVVLPMVVERGARTPALPSLIADGGSTTPRRAWASGAIAAVQVALAFALAVGGTFLVSSFYWAWRQDPGYSRDRIAIVEFGIQSTEADDLLRRADELRRVAREIPGVEAVAMEGQAFMRGSALRPAIQRPAGAARGREEAIPVTAEFFELLGFAPLRGRLFTAAEVAAGERVAVLSERAAKALWPGDDAVGKVLRSANGRVTTTVIGVVRDARYAVLERADYGQIYTPFFPFTRSTLFLKHGGDAGDTLRDAVARARAIPGVGVLRAATMREALGESVRLREFRAWVFGGFAFAALGVMAIGVFGLAAMSTARRTREIGLRIALGATRPRIVTSLIREHAPAVAVGLLAGGLLTWWGMQFLKSYLYQFTGQDVRIWALAMTAVVAVVLGGVAIPAVRSSRLDPLLTLRAE